MLDKLINIGLMMAAYFVCWVLVLWLVKYLAFVLCSKKVKIGKVFSVGTIILLVVPVIITLWGSNVTGRSESIQLPTKEPDKELLHSEPVLTNSAEKVGEKVREDMKKDSLNAMEEASKLFNVTK
jgi:hypothetical protein